jgi:ribonucleoside-diphosphate reductase alpha chain
VLNGELVRDLKKRGLWTEEMLDQVKYFDGELDSIEGVPQDLRDKYTTAFGIDYKYFIDAAARRQKWIDQSQSVNLFLPEADIKTLSHMYRDAWRKGLKTTLLLTHSRRLQYRESHHQREERGEGTRRPSRRRRPSKKEFSADEKKACSIEAMMNGEECEACQ